mgnify:CR=1 FL=1|jgi:hypothetical protein
MRKTEKVYVFSMIYHKTNINYEFKFKSKFQNRT